MSDEPLIRVVVFLERQALEDLELLVAYRHGGATRSAVVRQAVSWLRAKEAGWLVRARRYEQRRRDEQASDEEAQRLSRADRDRLSVEHLVGQALDLARAGEARRGRYKPGD